MLNEGTLNKVVDVERSRLLLEMAVEIAKGVVIVDGKRTVDNNELAQVARILAKSDKIACRSLSIAAQILKHVKAY